MKNQMNIMQANNLFQMDKIRKNNKIQEKKYQMKIIDLQNNLQKLRQDQIKQENEINRINNKIEELTNSYERDFNKVKIKLKDIKNKLQIDTKIEDYFLQRINEIFEILNKMNESKNDIKAYLLNEIQKNKEK